MTIAILLGIIVIAVGILQAKIASKMMKLAFKVVIICAIGFVAITAVRTGTMPTKESLLEQRDEIIVQIKKEVREHGKIPAEVQEKVDTYNGLVDKVQAFKDDKFFGGFIKTDLEGLKIDTSEWLK